MEFKKIQEIISKRNLGPSDCEYHTQRALENDGKVRVLVVKGEKEANVEYICPYCGYYGFVQKLWKRPFSVNCENCKKLIRIQKMKTLIDKDKKAGKESY